MSTLTGPLTEDAAATVLTEYHEAMERYRAAKRAAVDEAVATGGDALYAEPTVPFPAKTETIRRAEREYPALARQIAQRAAVGRVRARKIAAKIAAACGRCGAEHSGGC